MSIKIQIIVIVITLLSMFYIINKIRIKEIELRYSLLWMFLGVGIIVFASFPQVSGRVSHFLGISKSINMLFFAGFCFMLPIIFSLSVAVSKMSNKIKKLSQELALLEKQVKDKKE